MNHKLAALRIENDRHRAEVERLAARERELMNSLILAAGRERMERQRARNWRAAALTSMKLLVDAGAADSSPDCARNTDSSSVRTS